jgi:hypothetical protein
MERRKKPRKDWAIAKDDRGRSVLEWKVDYRHTKRRESDPCARTYDFLEKLTVPDLSIEDDGTTATRRYGCNPYDTAEPFCAEKLPDRK